MSLGPLPIRAAGSSSAPLDASLPSCLDAFFMVIRRFDFFGPPTF